MPDTFSKYWIADFAIAAALGAVASISIQPILVLLLGLWAVFLWRRTQQVSNNWSIVAPAGFQIATLLLVLVAAYWAPVKTTDRVLTLPVQLEHDTYTLVELKEQSGNPNSDVFPVSTSFTFSTEDASKKIAFSAQKLSLSEFIDTIESQSRLRHRFMHCGNGWTLLWGGDCSFGLTIRDPELVGPPPYPRPRYEREPELATIGE